ncbi:alpha/beta fold hydrolase [Propionivibrio sp.]|uniref:alpha/beta fold hydrolase n=1 Tax=Propionivibrio sp. TaxID=2212460 RepID=UPI0039E3BC82
MTRPDLVLIHGWGLRREVWSPCLDALREVADVRLADLPGYGETPDAGRSFAEAARALADSLPAQATLCGWSLGALLAMQAARLAPERIGKLILVGATPRFTQDEDWPAAQPASLLDDFAAAVANDGRATLQRFIALFNQGDSKARPIGRDIARNVLSSPLPATPTLLAGLGWLRDTDLRIQAPEIACPLLLIHGAHDPLMPLAAAQWLADRLPHARLEVFADAAHAPFLNDPGRFARLVGDFLHASRID